MIGAGLVAAKDTRENVLRIAPPLVIDDEAIDFLLTAFKDAIATLAPGRP